MRAIDSPIATTFHVDVRPDRQRVLLVARGELDLATVATVEEQALALCRRGFEDVCLDLSELAFFDSCALRMLIRLDATLTERDCRFSIVEGDGAAARVLTLTGTSDRFRHASRPR